MIKGTRTVGTSSASVSAMVSKHLLCHKKPAEIPTIKTQMSRQTNPPKLPTQDLSQKPLRVLKRKLLWSIKKYVSEKKSLSPALQKLV